MKLHLPNKLSLLRIVIGLVVVTLLGLPWSSFGITWPTFLIAGQIIVKTNYLVAAILFIVAISTDHFDGRIARKRGQVTRLGEILDSIADKILTNAILIILAYNHNISIIIPIIMVIRDIFADATKMLVIYNGGTFKTSKVEKIKNLLMNVGILLVLLGNIPFVFFNLAINQGLVIVAVCLAVYTCLDYFITNKKYFNEQEIK